MRPCLRVRPSTRQPSFPEGLLTKIGPASNPVLSVSMQLLLRVRIRKKDKNKKLKGDVHAEGYIILDRLLFT